MNIDEACKLAIANLAEQGCSDITKESFEKKFIAQNSEEFFADTKSKLNKGSVYDMEFKPLQFILSPKNRYVFDYRKAALIDPSCLAKYNTLAILAAPEIEKARIPTEDEIVFSARFKPESPAIFDKSINYGSWKEKIRELAEDDGCTYVVQCDIASFYDRVNIHRVESTLLDIGVEKSLTKKINELLLFWSKKDSYGIPVGNIGSRIFAEAALIDIDQYLLSEKINFIRYVDDYRLFAPNLATAQRWMNLLTTRLFRDGLMLNTGKTKLYLAKKGTEAIAEEKQESAEAIIKSITTLTGGYNRIARTFIMPAAEKFEAFKEISIKNSIHDLEKTDIPEFQGIQKLIIACLVQQKFNDLEIIAKLCSQYLYSLDYFADMLTKNADLIPDKNLSAIADYYANFVMSSEFGALEWHQATLASLLSNPKFFRKSALIHIIRSPNKESVTYPSMLTLEGLKDKLNRTEFRTIREWFDRSDLWEKRRIILNSTALPEDERKAWAKAIKPTIQSDFFCGRLIEKVISGKEI
jgi:hypothetical protein